MKTETRRRRLQAVTGSVALGLVVSTLAVAGDGFARSPTEPAKSDSPVLVWPYQTGALAGTAETFVDMRGDGSYYDPSLGRRVFRTTSPSGSGAVGGTAETFTDMREDGSYYDPSLGRRVSR
jgi:hypothetical protein